MGQLVARFNSLIDSFSKVPGRILMLGLDAAGKTTILYTLKLGESIGTVPTIGFNVEEVQVKGLTFMVWDIGGQDRIRSLWHHYFTNTIGLIFVLDSSDKERLKEAAQELRGILGADEMVNVPLLVFANKQDLPDALTPTAVADALGLHLFVQRRWHVQASNALTGDGVLEGLEQLSSMCKDRPKTRRK